MKRTASLVLLALAASCHGPASSGHLLIVGGGLQPDNAQVLSAFASAAGDRTLVLPTASGVPEESAPATQSMLAAYASAGQHTAILDIRHDTPGRAQDPAYIQPIQDASALWFTGGDQSRILAVFRPGESDSPAFVAMQDLLSRGGLIAGTSAGAAMISDPMIAGGTSERALLYSTSLPSSDSPELTATTGIDLAQGMGFFPYGIVDQHFLARGRFGRLIAAMEETRIPMGIGIADNRAILVDLTKSQATALGNHAAVIINTTQMTPGLFERNHTYDRTGIRISLASHHDTIDLATGQVRPAPGKSPLHQDESTLTFGTIATNAEPLDAWSRNALAQLIQNLAVLQDSPQIAKSPTYKITLRSDPQTKFWSGTKDHSDLTATHLILDITVRP